MAKIKKLLKMKDKIANLIKIFPEYKMTLMYDKFELQYATKIFATNHYENKAVIVHPNEIPDGVIYICLEMPEDSTNNPYGPLKEAGFKEPFFGHVPMQTETETIPAVVFAGHGDWVIKNDKIYK